MNKDIKPRNAKGESHGYWERYWSSGYLWYKCLWNNGLKVGYQEIYLTSNKLILKRYYL